MAEAAANGPGRGGARKVGIQVAGIGRRLDALHPLRAPIDQRVPQRARERHWRTADRGSGLCGDRPTRSVARQLGRRGASREPATGPALRGFDCARDTARRRIHSRCAELNIFVSPTPFPRESCMKPPGANWGWPPCRVADRSLPVSISAANPARGSQAPPRLAKGLLPSVSKPPCSCARTPPRSMTRSAAAPLDCCQHAQAERSAHHAGCCSSREAAMVESGGGSVTLRRKTTSACSPSWFLSRSRDTRSGGWKARTTREVTIPAPVSRAVAGPLGRGARPRPHPTYAVS